VHRYGMINIKLDKGDGLTEARDLAIEGGRVPVPTPGLWG